LFADARQTFNGSQAEQKFSKPVKFSQAVGEFFRERLDFYLRETRGFAYDVVHAVLATGADDVVDAVARAEAVRKVRPSADFESISVAFKRIKNILRQAKETGKRIGSDIDSSLLREEAERTLASLIPEMAKRVDALRAQRQYEAALLQVSKLRPAVDTFFDKVMVMVDDEDLRANRLALLATVLKDFSTIADFSEIVTEGKA
jgi:glycyl-tRNA synthetase beta chain